MRSGRCEYVISSRVLFFRAYSLGRETSGSHDLGTQMGTSRHTPREGLMFPDPCGIDPAPEVILCLFPAATRRQRSRTPVRPPACGGNTHTWATVSRRDPSRETAAGFLAHAPLAGSIRIYLPCATPPPVVAGRGGIGRLSTAGADTKIGVFFLQRR